MKYTLKAYSIWEQGPREKQEDSMYPKHGELADTDRLFILCDGMGGHSAGEIASSTVCAAMSDCILSQDSKSEGDFSDEDFKDALNKAYDALDQKDNGAAKKMGTTLTFLKLHNAGCTIAHIGDSRVYHIRPGKGIEDTEIIFQTEDHSLVNDLVKIGELTREEAKYSKQKNVITRAMQPCMERRAKADLYHSENIMPGDYFMLCSDGILEQMEDDNIKYIFSAKGGDISNKIDILIKATAHNHDNHSAILVNITDIEGAAPAKAVQHKPELLMAQETETVEQDSSENVAAINGDNNMTHSGNGGQDNRTSSMHQLIKNTICCIIWVIIGLGGYYLYKHFKTVKEPVENEAVTSNPSIKPEKPVSTLPGKRQVSNKIDEQPDVQIEVSSEDQTVNSDSSHVEEEEQPVAESSEASVAPASSPVTPESVISAINADNGSIPSSDEQLASEVLGNRNK